MPHNFMICAHGQLILDRHDNVEEFTVPKLSVFTFAPPTAGCMYSPENLIKLRNVLHTHNNELTDFSTFKRVVIRDEKKHIGFNYCDPDWIGYFGKQQNYDTTKGCGSQTSVIQNKLFSFEDNEISGTDNVFGIWNLDTNENILPTLPIEPVIIGGDTYYRFSDIMKFLEMAVRDESINVLDCSCSVIYDKNGKLFTDLRSQRRFQRPIKFAGKKRITKRKRRKTRGRRQK